MREKVNRMLDSIKDSQIERFAFTMILLWTTSPIIELIFKSRFRQLYTHYFTYAIYLIGFAGLLTYIIYFLKIRRENKLNIKEFIPEILLTILLILSVISTLLSKDPHLSFFGESYRREGLFVYIMYIGFILLSSTIKNRKYLKYILQSMLFACLIITINPMFRSDFSFFNFRNIFHNLNHYGYYLMINATISLFMLINSDKLWQETLYMMIFIFLLYLLILNDTFGSYLAIVVTLLFLFIYSMVKKYERLKVVFVIIVFIATSYTVSNLDFRLGEKVHYINPKGTIMTNITILNKDILSYVDNDREEKINTAGSYRGFLWEHALKYTLKHPLFGGGMESLNDYYISELGIYYGQCNDRPHNSILLVSSFIGIPGAIIYLIFIIYVAISNIKIMGHDTLHIAIVCTGMCYFISSMFGNSMYYTSPFFMIFLGLLIGFNRCNKKETVNC